MGKDLNSDDNSDATRRLQKRVAIDTQAKAETEIVVTANILE